MNWTVNFFELLALSVGIVGLILSFFIYRSVVARPAGNAKMMEIASAIREGAFAYLKAQALYLVPFIGVVFILITISKLGFETAVAYLMGSLFSLLAGFVGMTSATHANVRTAQAASENNAAGALEIAFDGGAVMGLAVASLGILGMVILFNFYGIPGLETPIIGFGMGASSIALFARVGGGIYTKAADVGADLVGKVEANIPEDDPRNPGVIADNVGDNVGDVAGMGADIFESYVACIIGALALGATASADVLMRLTSYSSQADMLNSRIWLMLTPIMVAVLGTIASYIAMKSMKLLSSGDPGSALRKVSIIAPAIFMVLLFGYLLVTPVNMNLWICALVGTLAGIGVGAITEYYTGSKPVFQIIEGAKTGPATGVIAGIALGFQSVAAPVLIIAAATFFSFKYGGFYGSALAGIAMLATVGITMTIDAYGPIADNAGGISEMAGLGKETRAITDKLDQLGNTTAAIGKGFAIGSAGLAALSLFGAYVESFEARGHRLELSLIDANVIVGIFIGATLPGLIVAFTMRSVGRAAGQMVTEIRRQFREIPGLLEGREGVKPDVSRCVQISTKAALSEMRMPGIVAIAAPVFVGFVFGAKALGGLLLGVTVVGMVIGIFMSNAGGAWDNAKKFIEQGMVEGQKKGGELHRAAVVGDTVGDPCKDTSGPSLNILIKLVSMLSLLIAPLLAI